MSEDKEHVREVIRAEKARLRPAGKAAERRHAERVRLVDELLRRGTEDDVAKVIQDAGLRPDSPQAQQVWRIWRENRR